jgi:hypothetical protein
MSLAIADQFVLAYLFLVIGAIWTVMGTAPDSLVLPVVLDYHPHA